ncbi:MAG: hypothetical protein IJZ94_03585 [Clostridia bacterium]|nr:hypothetical protein [Clostridia bacterium]
MEYERNLKTKTKLVSVYDSRKLHHTPFLVDENSSIGVKFMIDEKSKLTGITSFCPSYGDDIGTLPVMIYKWMESFEKTVAQKPVFESAMVDFADNMVVYEEIDGSVFCSGEYLLLFKDGKDGVGFWCSDFLPEEHPDKVKYGFEVFINGSENGAFIPMITFCFECITEDKTYEMPQYCGADYVRGGWALSDIPSYDYGVIATGVYDCGQGIYLKKDFAAENDSQMVCISETNINEYNAYIKKLRENNYTEEMHNEISANVYDVYSNGKKRIYCYYTDEYNTVRVIFDKTSASVCDFSYKYDKKPGDTTEIYQYGLCMAKFVNPDPNYLEYINCGMSYVIKLADNSLYVMDGGMFTQYDEAHCEKFISFLHEITGTEQGEKVRIACWSLTHGHDDHNSGFAFFMNKYNREIILERVLFNLPDEYNECRNLEGSCEYNHGAFEWIKAYWPDVIEMKCHTGQKFSLADIDIEILCTHEDIVDVKNGKSLAAEFNSSGSVFKLYFDNKVLLVTGDVTMQGEKILVETFEPDVLKCDVLQAPHHFFNHLYMIYKLASAQIVLAPQSSVFAEVLSSMKGFIGFVKTQCEKLYYGGDETVGLRVENGKIVDFYHADVVGGKFTGWPFK